MKKQKYIIFGLLLIILAAAFALRLSVTGIALWGLPVIFATLLVLGTFLLANELFQNYKAGLISAYLTAFSYWSVNLLQIGFETLILPTIVVFSFYFLFRGLRLRKLHDFIISGFILGLGFYSYTIIVFFCLILVPFLLFLIVINRKFIVDYWKHLFVLMLSAFIIAIPSLFGFFHISSESKILPANLSFYVHQLNPLLLILFLVGFIYAILKFLQTFWHHFQMRNVNQKIRSYVFLNLWLLLPFLFGTSFDLTAMLPAVIIISTIPLFLIMKKYHSFGHAFRVFIVSALSFVLLFIGMYDVIRYLIFLQNK